MPDIPGATNREIIPKAAQVGKRLRWREWGVAADGTVSAPVYTPFSPAVTAAPAAAVGPFRTMFGTDAQIAALPTSGAAWTFLNDQANLNTPGPISLGSYNDPARAWARETMARALRWKRLGNTVDRDAVHNRCAQIINTQGDLGAQGATDSRNQILATARAIAAYVFAAELTGYRTTAWVNWLTALPTTTIGTHGRWKTLQGASRDTISNQGWYYTASRMAIARYLGDTATLNECVALVRAAFEGRAHWPASAGGTYFFNSAANDGTNPAARVTWFDPGASTSSWLAVNPTNAATAAKAGIPGEDASRSGEPSGYFAYPNMDETGKMYMNEGFMTMLLCCLLVQDAGFPEVWTWGNSAPRRVAERLSASGWEFYTFYSFVSEWVPFLVRAKYGTVTMAANPPQARFGRNFGFTDWLQPILTGTAGGGGGGTETPPPSGGGTVQFSETFAGVADNQPWPSARWGAALVSTGASAIVVTTEGRHVLGTLGAYGDYVESPATGITVGNHEITLKVRSGAAAEFYPTVVFRQVDTNNKYALQFDPAFAVAQLRKRVAGTWTNLGASFAIPAAGTATSVRIHANGSALKARAWSGATEPTTWGVEVTDTGTVHASGGLTILTGGGSPATSRTAFYDDITVTTI